LALSGTLAFLAFAFYRLDRLDRLAWRVARCRRQHSALASPPALGTAARFERAGNHTGRNA